MTVSTLRPASSASTASSWPGRKSSKPKISFRISCFELRLAPSRFIKLLPELGSRLRGLPPEPEGLKGGGQGVLFFSVRRVPKLSESSKKAIFHRAFLSLEFREVPLALASMSGVDPDDRRA